MEQARTEDAYSIASYWYSDCMGFRTHDNFDYGVSEPFKFAVVLPTPCDRLPMRSRKKHAQYF